MLRAPRPARPTTVRLFRATSLVAALVLKLLVPSTPRSPDSGPAGRGPGRAAVPVPVRERQVVRRLAALRAVPDQAAQE